MPLEKLQLGLKGFDVRIQLAYHCIFPHEGSCSARSDVVLCQLKIQNQPAKQEQIVLASVVLYFFCLELSDLFLKRVEALQCRLRTEPSSVVVIHNIFVFSLDIEL